MIHQEHEKGESNEKLVRFPFQDLFCAINPPNRKIQEATYVVRIILSTWSRDHHQFIATGCNDAANYSLLGGFGFFLQLIAHTII
jgi:hypothetical protein